MGSKALARLFVLNLAHLSTLYNAISFCVSLLFTIAVAISPSPFHHRRLSITMAIMIREASNACKKVVIIKEDSCTVELELLTVRGVVNALTNSCRREDSSRLSRLLNPLLYLAP